MTWLGRYELVEPLGRGAMGEIWRARDSMLDREVAVKVVTRCADDPLEDERLLREAHAAARISHPNVVSLFDVGRSEGRPFLVMELIEGCTLAAILKVGPLPFDEVRSILVQTLAGLRAAHAQDVVHRDIKPANIMVEPDGVVKIVDFGLADDGWGARITRQGAFMGTAAYAAPERVRGDGFDAGADLYSLGCVLYEMLTGRPPFEGDILAQTYSHVHHCPEPPSRLRRSVPRDLDAFAIALLAKDPHLRPDSLEDFGPRLPGVAGGLGGGIGGFIGGLVARRRSSTVRRTALAVALVATLTATTLLAIGSGQLPESADTPGVQERPEQQPPGSAPPTIHTGARSGPGAAPSPLDRSDGRTPAGPPHVATRGERPAETTRKERIRKLLKALKERRDKGRARREQNTSDSDADR